MRRAIQVASPLAQSLRASTTARSAGWSTRAPVAGPSSRRCYANTVDPASASLARAGEASNVVEEEELLGGRAVHAEAPSVTSASFRASLPANITFEGFDEGESIVPRKDKSGVVLHRRTDPLGPYEMPMSSLSSANPTQADPSGEMIELQAEIFGKPLRRDILHRCVVWFLANLRQGSQSTKTRATVAYSGRKLRQQKGTGKARVGDASSGIRRGGAPIFPLHPRDHSQLLPRKIRALGLYTALSSKLSSGLLRIVPSLAEAGWEGTNAARRALSNDVTWEAVEGDQEEMRVTERFGRPDELSILFIRSTPDETFERVIRNIQGVEVIDLEDVQVWHVLKYKWCVMEREVVEALSALEMGLESIEGLEEELSLDSTPAPVVAT